MMTQINLNRAIPKRKLSWDIWMQAFSVKPGETINFDGPYQLYADNPTTKGVWVKFGKEVSAFILQYKDNAWSIFRNNLGTRLDIFNNERGSRW
jgi:hypothetical protein